MMAYRYLFALALCLYPLSTPAIASEQTSSIPHNIPSHWNAKLLDEPIFNSKIMVIESGHDQHETVLLVHGLGQNGFKDWLETIKTLESNYHVIALDLPGFGHSSLPQGRFSPENYANVLNWLLNHKEKNNAHLVGHSMGAAIVLQFGAMHPSKVKSIVLVDVAGLLHRSAFIKHFAQPPLMLDFVPENLKRQAYKILHFSDTLAKFINKAPDPGPLLQRYDLLWNLATVGKPNSNAALALIETDFTNTISHFSHPTTIIWGANDRIAPIRTGKLLVKHLKNAELHIIPGADHIPMKSQTQTFMAILTKALIAPPQHIEKNHTFSYGKDNLHCKNLVDITYSGTFDNIILENCTEVTLDKVFARSLVIKDSIVHIDDSIIKSNTTACLFSDSKIIATNTQCIGSIALDSNNDILDFAGVKLTGKKIAVRLQGQSEIILSVSEINSPIYQGNAHNVYKTQSNLEPVIIDQQF